MQKNLPLCKHRQLEGSQASQKYNQVPLYFSNTVPILLIWYRIDSNTCVLRYPIHHLKKYLLLFIYLYWSMWAVTAQQLKLWVSDQKVCGSSLSTTQLPMLGPWARSSVSCLTLPSDTSFLTSWGMQRKALHCTLMHMWKNNFILLHIGSTSTKPRSPSGGNTTPQSQATRTTVFVQQDSK